VRYCAQRGCPGHPDDNIPDCLTEAVWRESQHGPVLTTGSLDYEGVYTLVIFELAVDVVLTPGLVVEVLSGAYLLGLDCWGNRGMLAYPLAEDGRRLFGRIDADYQAWLRSWRGDLEH
jgi:hypothetical protein